LPIFFLHPFLNPLLLPPSCSHPSSPQGPTLNTFDQETQEPPGWQKKMPAQVTTPAAPNPSDEDFSQVRLFHVTT
jgi:hypothetical protein